MVYMAGDNNLSNAALVDLAEMEAVGSDKSIHVIVQMDTLGGGTQRLVVQKGKSTLVQDLGEQNMADPQTLTDFLSWAQGRYLARHHALILWDHGDGYLKPNALPDEKTLYGILQDDTDGTACCLSNVIVRQAIESAGVRIDLLGFDASQMGQVETAYEFRNMADLLVFSQETGQSNGWDYTAILNGMAAQPGMTPDNVAALIVSSYEDFYEQVFYPANPGFEQSLTVSAVRLGLPMEDLARVIDDLSQALISAIDDNATRVATLAAISASRSNSQDLLGSFCNLYVDLFDWVERLQLEPAIGPAANNAMVALLGFRDALILAEYHGLARPGAKGLSIVFMGIPNPSCSNFDPGYLDGSRPLSFLNSTQWNEFLSSYYTSSGLL